MRKHIRITITVEKDLYELAKKHNINISKVCERALRDYIRENFGEEYLLEEEKEVLKYSSKVLEILRKR